MNIQSEDLIVLFQTAVQGQKIHLVFNNSQDAVNSALALEKMCAGKAPLIEVVSGNTDGSNSSVTVVRKSNFDLTTFSENATTIAKGIKTATLCSFPKLTVSLDNDVRGWVIKSEGGNKEYREFFVAWAGDYDLTEINVGTLKVTVIANTDSTCELLLEGCDDAILFFTDNVAITMNITIEHLWFVKEAA